MISFTMEELRIALEGLVKDTAQEHLVGPMVAGIEKQAKTKSSSEILQIILAAAHLIQLQDSEALIREALIRDAIEDGWPDEPSPVGSTKPFTAH